MAAVGVLLLLALAVVCGGRRLVEVNSGVQVIRGRSAFITEKELKISEDPTADCKVEVVMNEPVTQRVGRLTPQVFDCSFLEDEVKYIHNGSPQLDEDSVMLRVYRFTSSDTLVETVLLPVRVVDSGSGVVELGSAPLVVPQFYALSNAIDSSILNIRTTSDLVCTIRLMTTDTSIPALGQLVREEDSTQRKGRETAALCPGNKPCLHDTKEVRFLKTSCQDFLSSGLKYQHLSPPSPEIDYIPIRVELREQATRALLEAESVWLPVLIHGAMQNQPPQAAFMASFILEVDQFILTPLTTAALDAKDHETPQERLVFNVTAPPAEGYITHLDDHTKPITSFTWLDLHEMKVAYQPPNSSQSQRRNHEMEFQVIDGSYVTSPPIMVHISIRAAETNAPRVSWNMGLDLLEGQSRPITWEELQIVDSDNINAVYLVAVDGPLHGRLSVRGVKWGRGHFARGRGSAEAAAASLSVHVGPFQPSAPRDVLFVSNGGSGGTEQIGGTYAISCRRAQGADALSPNRFSCYQLGGGSGGGGGGGEGAGTKLTKVWLRCAHVFEAPETGSPNPGNRTATGKDAMFYPTGVHSTNPIQRLAVPSGAKRNLLFPSGKAFMFRVRDLREGAVVYHHSDSDTTRDHIVFRISDGRHSIRHKFPINILPKDDSPPFLINNVAVEVQEGGAVRLEEYMLLASDLDSSDDYILYQVVSSPRAGQLVRKTSTHETGAPVDSFLQRDLIQGQIYYQHSGDEQFEDSFDFTLSDSHQPPNLSQTYTVVVQVFPVKDQLPVEVSGSVRSLTVKETEVVYVTPAHLHFTDREHPDTDLTYVITQPCFSPLHAGLMDAGRLFYTDSTNSMKKDHMVPVLKSFTQHAVNHMKVAFMPPVEDIGPEPLFVQFVFSVSDHHGGTVSGLVFNITVTPVDDRAPEDRDSREEVLRVEVQRVAHHGRLELQGRALHTGDRFTLQDLRGLRLRYIHDDSETTEDEVYLKVTDGLNSVQVVLLIQVLPMNDEPPQLGGGLRGELTCQEGGRVQVTVDYLSATDLDSDDSRLTYMLARSPGRGELQRAGLTVDKFSQQDLLQGHIYYAHTGESMLVVDEGSSACLCGGVLGASDPDSPPDQLTFHLETPPLHGFLENTLPPPGSEKSNAGVRVESFSLVHLTSGFINYVQSESKGVEPTVDQLTISVSDGLHRSAPVPFYIIINPTNDETPR
ncbi:FRAS1-related extracellular matrix protein 1 [Larimichthys crocea]|uniref:FRAS1-related extracellular matrix protein 1 n=1 Tax=Larimichthys crocea TaxID=215358 RepID=A0A6G0IT39_LARCR|nr:FRAS1-related extracellular matrix protein 1 [Larimichthys crocea]